VLLCALAAPFAWAQGRKAERAVDAAPGVYAGRGMGTAGKILGIIGTILLIIGIIVILLVVITGGFSFNASTEY
jgi:hypothetical protein